MNNSFLLNVSKNIDRFRINLRSRNICVCLSGGADSCALLYSVVMLKNQYSYKVFALHVNHLIRGEESYRDEEFCISICKELDIDLTVKRVNVPSVSAERKKGLEETAREIRYEIIDSLSDRFDYFLTAHNANDNAETVLFNIIRGCAVNGLCGIPDKRGNIIRPLLNIERKEIIEFLKSIDRSYVTDSTNLTLDYTRNYIRNEIIPHLQKINPDIIGSINRLSTLADNDESFFSAILDNEQFSESDSFSLISRKILRDYKTYALIQKDLKNPGKNLSMVHINAIINALNKTESAVITLPHGIYAVVENHKYFFTVSPPKSIKYEKVFLTEKDNFFADNKVKISLTKELSDNYEQSFSNVNNLFKTISLKCDKIKGNIYARSRISGDKIKCLNVSKSIKKEFIAKKIPASMREIIPIICDDEGIIYVPFIGAADRVYEKEISSSEKLILTVEFIKKGDAELKI